MSQKPIRTRFAPSPTGYLHVGGARTALFSYLYARKHQGTFVLRVEDTDRERSTPESVQAILDGMAWLGLNYDEGPYYQTEHFNRYQQVLMQLLEEGKAYRCYCSKERLEDLRETQMANKKKPRYDGHCRDLNRNDADQPFVIRFRNPADGAVEFSDLIRGTITIQNSELDDLIIARSDGVPTYNFTVCVDDWDMRITHVIRGDDHINNTPRQINLLHALGADIPQYAHVPMILGGDGKRLSKRHGAMSVMQYRDDGYLPQAMLNYLARLGWAHGDQELFTHEELKTLFDLDGVSRSPARFDMEKLGWVNQQYLKSLDVSHLVVPFEAQLSKLNIPYSVGPKLEDVIAIQVERVKTLHEMAERSAYFFQDFEDYDEKAAKKNFKVAVVPAMQAVHEQFLALASWDKAELHQIIIDTAEKFEVKLGKLAQPIRIAVTGGSVSPPIDITLELIGRERVLKRLQNAIEVIRAMEGQADGQEATAG